MSDYSAQETIENLILALQAGDPAALALGAVIGATVLGLGYTLFGSSKKKEVAVIEEEPREPKGKQSGKKSKKEEKKEEKKAEPLGTSKKDKKKSKGFVDDDDDETAAPVAKAEQPKAAKKEKNEDELKGVPDHRSLEEREKEKLKKAARKAKKAQEDAEAKVAGKAANKAASKAAKQSAKDVADGWVLEDGHGKHKAPAPALTIAAPAGAAAAAAAAVPVDTKVFVDVDAKKVGNLIGPKGATLHKIQALTETRIDTGSKEKKEGPVKVSITSLAGDAAKCNEEKKIILELCQKGYSAALMGDNFTEASVEVHPSHIPLLIGTKGAVIIALRDALNVQMTMPENSKQVQANAKKVKVGVAGNKHDVEKAKAVIDAITSVYHHELTHPGVVHNEVAVPEEYYRFLIGKSGSEMRHIQANFKVSVYIPNENSRNRNVVVVGAKDAVGNAVRYINKVVTTAKEQPQLAAEPVDKFGDESHAQQEEWMDEYMYRRS